MRKNRGKVKCNRKKAHTVYIYKFSFIFFVETKPTISCNYQKTVFDIPTCEGAPILVVC